MFIVIVSSNLYLLLSYAHLIHFNSWKEGKLYVLMMMMMMMIIIIIIVLTYLLVTISFVSLGDGYFPVMTLTTLLTKLHRRSKLSRLFLKRYYIVLN